MNRFAAHCFPADWRRAAVVLAVLTALGTMAGAEEQRGRAIEFSTSRSGAAITNRSAANRQQLQDDMFDQQRRDRITKPFRANQDSLEGVLAAPQPQQRGLSPAEIKRLKEYIAQRNNWMFADPDAIGKTGSPDGSGQFDASSGEETGLEKNSLKALKRFYQNKSANQAQGTNGSGNGGNSESADERDGLGRKDRRKSGEQDTFGKTSGGDSAPKGWFGSDSNRDANAADQPSTFPDAFSPTAFVPLQRTAADEQHFNEFKKLLDSGSAASALGLSGNSAPAQSPLSGILNNSGSARAMDTMPGYKPNPITSLAPAQSSAFSSTTPMLNLPPPAARTMQFTPVLPPRRTF